MANALSTISKLLPETPRQYVVHRTISDPMPVDQLENAQPDYWIFDITPGHDVAEAGKFVLVVGRTRITFDNEPIQIGHQFRSRSDTSSVKQLEIVFEHVKNFMNDGFHRDTNFYYQYTNAVEIEQHLSYMKSNEYILANNIDNIIASWSVWEIKEIKLYLGRFPKIRIIDYREVLLYLSKGIRQHFSYLGPFTDQNDHINYCNGLATSYAREQAGQGDKGVNVEALGRFLARVIPSSEVSSAVSEVSSAVDELRRQLRAEDLKSRAKYVDRQEPVDPIEFLSDTYKDELRFGNLGAGTLQSHDKALYAAIERRIAKMPEKLTVQEYFDSLREPSVVGSPSQRKFDACAKLVGASWEQVGKFFSSVRPDRIPPPIGVDEPRRPGRIR